MIALLHCPCAVGEQRLVHTYMAPPPGEVRFAFAQGSYRRELWRCETCGHFLSRHAMDTSSLYEGEYVRATYQDEAGMKRSFERIINLPAEKSDNKGRVRRILDFAATRFAHTAPSVLDVGSGLCVFLHEMRQVGWRCTALDPDERAARHARETVGVAAICGDFRRSDVLGQYDVITLNKVLEHVEDPIAMLARCRSLAAPGGFVYVELPDGEAAFDDSPDREEFFIDHWHVFSPASLALLARRAGFQIQTLERLREPSTKYTLRGFLTP